ncbi:MAG: Cache 3/Cache 2 fusion domain-containing protein [Candidatus Niyogibacteria bacterium]|nr:Cache 3/Cache 2 fusion domain-containing protein [Candidatus Niyogibacteria bacterium]
MQKRTLLISVNIIIFLLVLAATLIFTQVLWGRLVENLIKEEQEHEMTFAGNIANILRLEMENQITLFTQIAQLPEIQSSDPAVCNQKLDDLFFKYGKKLTNIGRMNAKGIFDCSYNRDAIGVNGPSVAPHLKTIIEDPEHRPVLGRIIPPVAGTVSAGPITSFHVPIFDKNGKFLGTLGGAINFNDLKDKYLKDVIVLQQGYAVITDDNGDILYHPRTEFMGKNVWSEEMQNNTGRSQALNEMWKNVAAGKTDIVRYVFEGKEKIAAYVPATVLPGRVWGVTVTVPLEDLQKILLTQGINRVFLQFNLTIAAIIILAFILLQFFEVRWLFKPLNNMDAALKKLSQGDFTDADILLDGGGKDEFSQLSQNLRGALAVLWEKTANVDEAVAEKTRTLESKVAELEAANKAMIGRELKMMELKKEIEELKNK